MSAPTVRAINRRYGPLTAIAVGSPCSSWPAWERSPCGPSGRSASMPSWLRSTRRPNREPGQLIRDVPVPGMVFAPDGPARNGHVGQLGHPAPATRRAMPPFRGSTTALQGVSSPDNAGRLSHQREANRARMLLGHRARPRRRTHWGRCARAPPHGTSDGRSTVHGSDSRPGRPRSRRQK
jgi:hypothetical protein